ILSDGGTIPVVGGQTAGTLSVERILALEPDLVVATAYMEPDLGEGILARRLEAAGIPVVFSNAASNREPAGGAAGDPFDDMARTLRMWGAVLDKSGEAEAFIAFVQGRLARVKERLGATPPTKAYLEVQSTYDDCCWVAGQRIWGDLLGRAGGRNLSAVDAPWYAKVATEQLMAEAPAVYIASGGAFGTGIRPAIGPGLDPAKGRAGLRRLTERTGFDTLPAVRNGRVHGVWTGLLTVPPLNILFVEVAAKWLHPGAFRDAEPNKTREEINRRFLRKPLPGPCWLSLAA
ncbi:MAG: ABC transporter substrate-binding protein, partial [Hyphomicrobiales bacterium]|nr:ABC transporter substrate-binding protein [Hyphomicrobiales bacterium]